MTHKARSMKIFAMLVLVATCLVGTSYTSRSTQKRTGYYREIKYAQYFQGVPCYDNAVVWMKDADDEIELEQEVWQDDAMTIPFPDMRITSQYGSSYGTTFMVVNGHIYDYSTVAPCWEP